jgi:8-oxo-dGTP pyrophosphatase MutT (NUDIX family)
VRPVVNSSVTSSPIRDAATVMLVRDAPDLHVLMLRRNINVVFSPGATVFPGGAVDAADAAPAMLTLVIGLDDAEASDEHNLPSGGLALRIAAVRECFEEAGILLARDARARKPTYGDEEPFAAWRDRCNAGDATLVEVLEAEGLVIDADDLRLFSHWLTPLGAPRRYNTWFFVARAPEGHDGAHDYNELVDSAWVRPSDALAAFEFGEIDLILPTQRSLEVIARYQSAAELWAALPPAGHAGLAVADGSERVALPSDVDAVPHRWTNPLPDIEHERRTVSEATCPT